MAHLGSQGRPPRRLLSGVNRPWHPFGGLGGWTAVIRQDECVFTPKQTANLAPVGVGCGDDRVQVNAVNQASGIEVKTTKPRRGNVDVHDIIVSSVGDGIALGHLDGPL
jgi:hypothetical protein